MLKPNVFHIGPISSLPRCAMVANLVHCGIESGPKQNDGCDCYCKKEFNAVDTIFQCKIFDIADKKSKHE